MVIGRAAEEAVQEKGDVLQHHLPGLLRHLEGMGVPAPVPVQEHAAVQQLLQLAAGGGLAHAHGAADHIQALHVPASAAPSAQAWRRENNRPTWKPSVTPWWTCTARGSRAVISTSAVMLYQQGTSRW